MGPRSAGFVGFLQYITAAATQQYAGLVTRNGFELVSVEPFFYQSAYFDFFLPFF